MVRRTLYDKQQESKKPAKLRNLNLLAKSAFEEPFEVKNEENFPRHNLIARIKMKYRMLRKQSKELNEYENLRMFLRQIEENPHFDKKNAKITTVGMENESQARREALRRQVISQSINALKDFIVLRGSENKLKIILSTLDVLLDTKLRKK